MFCVVLGKVELDQTPGAPRSGNHDTNTENAVRSDADT